METLIDIPQKVKFEYVLGDIDHIFTLFKVSFIRYVLCFSLHELRLLPCSLLSPSSGQLCLLPSLGTPPCIIFSYSLNDFDFPVMVCMSVRNFFGGNTHISLSPHFSPPIFPARFSFLKHENSDLIFAFSELVRQCSGILFRK